MTEYHFAFLRGINLGKRQIRMADLRTCLAEIGLENLKTILASGNVRFTTSDQRNLKSRIEAAIEARFGFPVGVILRSGEDIASMLDSKPFSALDPKADAQRFVQLFDAPLPDDLHLTGVPGVFDVMRIDRRDVFLAAYRQPNGRYTEGFSALTKTLDTHLGKDRLETMRNFNTIEKALA